MIRCITTSIERRLVMPRYLNFMLVRQIKTALWTGARHSDVAQHFGVSQPSVSNICNGRTWQDIPWPDGSKGAMPIPQRIALQASRYRGNAGPYIATTNTPYLASPGSAASQLDPRAIEAEFDRLQAEEDAAVMKKFLEPATPEERGSDVEVKYPRPILDVGAWDKLVDNYPDNPFVKAALAGSINAKIAVVETFRQVPEDQWESDMVDRYIQAALKELNRSNIEQDS